MAAAGTAYSWTGKRIRSSGDWVGDPKRNGVLSLTPPQLEELRQQLEQQEEELSRLRLGVVRLLGWAQERLESHGNARCILMASLSVRGRQIQRKEFSISHWRMKP